MAGLTRNHRPYGRTIRCAGGYRAFLPAPLPPPIEWSGRLVAALSHADLAVGRLAGEGRRLPDPHLFVRSFIRREAVLSSRIEGTRTTLAELLAVEAGAKGTADSADLHEVANYVAALEYGLDRLDTLPLSLRLIRELHERLMRGVRGGAATPGAFRRSQNWIGPPGCTLNDASYIPPPPEELTGCLDALERFLHADDLPVLVQAALAHAQFEAIHPFLDSNGRVGRLLITLLLAERGVKAEAWANARERALDSGEMERVLMGEDPDGGAPLEPIEEIQIDMEIAFACHQFLKMPGSESLPGATLSSSDPV